MRIRQRPTSKARVRAITLALAVVAGVVGAVGSPTVVSATPTAPGAGSVAVANIAPEHEAAFVAKINALRQARGLSTLTVDNELTEQARAWTRSMAQTDSLDHARDLSIGINANWQVLGENIGVHSIHDIDALFNAFVNSPGHYANLVDPRYNTVGVGVVHADDGKIWTTHRFMARTNAAPPPPPPPTTAAPTTTAPPTTARPTTAPPTTARPTTAPPTTERRTTAPALATRPSSTAGQPAPTASASTAPEADPQAITTSIPEPPADNPEPAAPADTIDVELITEVLIDLAESGL